MLGPVRGCARRHDLTGDFSGSLAKPSRASVFLRPGRLGGCRHGPLRPPLRRLHRLSVWVEQEPGSGGKESAQISVRELAGHDVHAERVTGDKVTRATPLAAQMEAGTSTLLEPIIERRNRECFGSCSFAGRARRSSRSGAASWLLRSGAAGSGTSPGRGRSLTMEGGRPETQLIECRNAVLRSGDYFP